MSSPENTGSISKESIIKMLTREVDQLKRTINEMNENCISLLLHEQRTKALEDEIQKLKDANIRETCYAADLKIEFDTLRENLRKLIKPT